MNSSMHITFILELSQLLMKTTIDSKGVQGKSANISKVQTNTNSSSIVLVIPNLNVLLLPNTSELCKHT